MSSIKGINTVADLKRLCPGAQIEEAAIPAPRTPRPARMVEPGIAFTNHGLTVVLPTETKSESNGRDWKARSRRTKNARKIWQDFMARHHARLNDMVSHLHMDDGAVRVTITRLGGRKLDDDNLRSAGKATRDAIAASLYVDDGDPRLHFCYGQEPDGDCGVRIEIEEM